MIGSLLKPRFVSTNTYARAGIILAVFALSIILGFRTPTFSIAGLGAELLVGGILLIIFLLVALRRLEIGVLLLVITAFFVRFTLPTGTQSRIPASLVLSVLVTGVWIVWMLLKRELRLIPSPTNLPMFGFVITSLFSMPWSWLSWRPEFWWWTTESRFIVTQVGGLSVMVLLPAVFLVAMNVFRDVKWYKWLVGLMVLIAVPELLQRFTGIYPQFAGLGISGPGLYHMWMISLLYAQVLFNDHLDARLRIFFVGLVIAWFLYSFIFRLAWFSGWMPLLLSILFLTFLKSKKTTLILLAVMAIPFLLAADYYYVNILVKAQYADFNRFTFLWPTIIFDLTLTKAGVLLGAGPAGYTPYFMTYYPGQSMSAHNNYVDIIAETGIIGTFFFIWFLIAVFRTGWKQRVQIKDGFLLAFNNGVLAGFVGMLLAMMLDDWFIPFAYNNGLPGFDMNVYAWILLGAMVGLGRVVADKSSGKSQ